MTPLFIIILTSTVSASGIRGLKTGSGNSMIPGGWKSPLKKHKQGPLKKNKQEPLKKHKQEPLKKHKQGPLKKHKQEPLKKNKQGPLKKETLYPTRKPTLWPTFMIKDRCLPEYCTEWSEEEWCACYKEEFDIQYDLLCPDDGTVIDC